MAGMRPFVLSGEFGAAYWESLAAAGCPSSQIAIDKSSAVPLWKVIVGPAPTNCKPGPQGSGFLLLGSLADSIFCGRPLSRNDPKAAAQANWVTVRGPIRWAQGGRDAHGWQSVRAVGTTHDGACVPGRPDLI